MVRVKGLKNPKISLSLASRSPFSVGSEALPHYPNLAGEFPQAWPQAHREEAPSPHRSPVSAPGALAAAA